MNLTQLNERQREAVLTTEGPLLILAGAGSGKTRTLTQRIAYLMDEKGVKPYEILAITFTNKAAGEMRERIEREIGDGVEQMWVHTFHAMCMKILRRNLDRLPGYTRWFSIYDEDDSQAVIRNCLSELNLAERYYPARSMLSFISNCKNQMLSPDEAAKGQVKKDQHTEQLTSLYRLYEKKLHEQNALDFDDLLIRTLELFVQCPDVLDYYRGRFRYIHVDEYQDTNLVQYELVRALSSQHGNLCVVGDDDQAIYGWRGADIRNILEFEKDFPNARVIRLEQNYRSTTKILDAANAVIARNASRKRKNLWTDRGQGEPIVYFQASTEREEAAFVCREIRRLVEGGDYRLADVAILYRMNAQSRVLEDSFLRAGIPYRMVGGLRFYDRKEIRDIMAYLKALVNPQDAVALTRIINVPRRGIGDTTVNALRQAADEHGTSIYTLLSDTEALRRIVPRAAAKLQEFQRLLEALQAGREGRSLLEYVQFVIQRSGYEAMLQEDDSDEAQARLENLGELISAVQEFMAAHEEARLEDFLENVALVSDLDNLEGAQRAVPLLTVHAAKGLEYPIVFVTGLEEGLFPHQRALIDERQMEEERRLCYVAITRAKDRLYLSSSVARMIFGTTQYNAPSRFLRDLPEETVQRVGGAPAPARWAAPKSPTGAAAPVQPKAKGWQTPPPSAAPKQEAGPLLPLQPGCKVRHARFGIGTVVALDGQPGKRTVTVAFAGQGVKLLNEAFANLQMES